MMTSAKVPISSSPEPTREAVRGGMGEPLQGERVVWACVPDQLSEVARSIARHSCGTRNWHHEPYSESWNRSSGMSLYLNSHNSRECPELPCGVVFADHEWKPGGKS